MTLVAAYRPKGVPVLLGDFLITGAGSESTRKKIHRIGPNFVIGWAGRLIFARPILKSLFEEFGAKSVTMSEVHRFLTNRPREELLTAKQTDELNDREIPLLLLGWIIDENPHCFLWNITYPEELFYAPFHLVGSGETKFRQLVTRESMGGSWGKNRDNINQAILSALANAAELYSDENLERMNRKKGFGYGYELLYFDGNEFRYLDNVAFLGMDILLNPKDWTGRTQGYDVWYRYSSLGDAAFLQSNNLKTGNITFEVIHPAFDQKLSDASLNITAGSFRSDYYCIYLRLQTQSGESYLSSLVLSDKGPGPSLYEKFENGQYRFELGRDLIKFIYENIKAETEHNKQNKIRWGWGSAETRERVTAPNAKIEFQIGQSDKTVAVGLIPVEGWNQHFEAMEFAIMCCPDSTIQIYERGVAVGPFGRSYKTDNTLSIGIENMDQVPKVKYYLNQVQVYQSLIMPQLPMRGAFCALEEGASVKTSRILGNWLA